jgi:putative flavoprotein involved in K+ transport
MHDLAPTTQVSRWLAALDAALTQGDVTAAAGLFAAECYWRDLVAFTWNITTVEGQDGIGAMLGATLRNVRPSGWRIEGEATAAGGVTEGWFTFETAVARGRGHVRLVGDRSVTLLTTIAELKGHEERRGATRERGVEHGAVRNRKSWLDLRREEEAALGATTEPYSVIVGGGQGGIALAARLRRLGVPTIILEKNRRAGDSWRNRYSWLVLHDPVWYDHMPYLPFPDHWPVFTPKDKMGDWLEMYARVMELNYWASSECLAARFDEDAKEWVLRVDRAGAETALRCKQLVFATGAYGPPNEISLPGAGSFAGEQYHSSRHVSGDRFQGKRAIVIGSNSSAHDIAVDLWESGAGVTMVQRSPTTVVRSETLMELAFGGLYLEEALKNGLTTEKADLIVASLPFRLMADRQRPLYEEIARRDADLYARLAKAGFLLDFGVDGSGLMMKALRTGSGYYIDVGGSELIASGAVKLKAGVEVKEVRPRSLLFTDDSELPAELIVYATGYQSMNRWLAKLISEEAADAVGPCWGYGSGTPGDPGPWQGELRNMWKPTALPALWFHGGNLALSRHYSLYLALQLKARFEGIPTPVYG